LRCLPRVGVGGGVAPRPVRAGVPRQTGWMPPGGCLLDAGHRVLGQQLQDADVLPRAGTHPQPPLQRPAVLRQGGRQLPVAGDRGVVQRRRPLPQRHQVVRGVEHPLAGAPTHRAPGLAETPAPAPVAPRHLQVGGRPPRHLPRGNRGPPAHVFPGRQRSAPPHPPPHPAPEVIRRPPTSLRRRGGPGCRVQVQVRWCGVVPGPGEAKEKEDDGRTDRNVAYLSRRSAT
jgi:hypothetical protein